MKTEELTDNILMISGKVAEGKSCKALSLAQHMMLQHDYNNIIISIQQISTEKIKEFGDKNIFIFDDMVAKDSAYLSGPRASYAMDHLNKMLVARQSFAIIVRVGHYE